jgi:hypothetical protein
MLVNIFWRKDIQICIMISAIGISFNDVQETILRGNIINFHVANRAIFKFTKNVKQGLYSNHSNI